MKAGHITIGAFEAKNSFSELLDRVSRGAEITITKHDRPVARLVPAHSQGGADRRKAAAAIRLLSQKYSLKGMNTRELLKAGRK